MPRTIRVMLTDDLEMHRSMLRMNLGSYTRNHPEVAFQVLAECANGGELLTALGDVEPDLITLDIRMPEMDGLTTLLHLRRRLRLRCPILMASSEEEANVDRFFKERVSEQVRSLSFDDKCGHMDKVEERVLSGQREAGKINDLLPGCEKLRLDPVRYADHLGASGFLQKPYTPEQTDTALAAVLAGKAFQASR